MAIYCLRWYHTIANQPTRDAVLTRVLSPSSNPSSITASSRTTRALKSFANTTPFIRVPMKTYHNHPSIRAPSTLTLSSITWSIHPQKTLDIKLGWHPDRNLCKLEIPETSSRVFLQTGKIPDGRLFQIYNFS